MQNKKIILVAAAFVALVGILLGVYLTTRPGAALGPKEITVTVVHADGSEKSFSYTTRDKTLGAFLEGEGLISSQGADPGMFHTVDGEKADWSVNQSYWAFYVNGEYAMTGIYDTYIQNGESYALVYTIG